MIDPRETLAGRRTPFLVEDVAFRTDGCGRRAVSFAARTGAGSRVIVQDASTLSEQISGMLERGDLPGLVTMRASRWRDGQDPTATTYYLRPARPPGGR